MTQTLANPYLPTTLRVGKHISSLSGMCASCSDQCTGLCEIGLSAIRGPETTYPYDTTTHQFAAEKSFPFTYEDFNINGRLFNPFDVSETQEQTNVFSACTKTVIGDKHPIKLKIPIILPAIAKLDWEDYYTGAALAGTIATIGESAIKNDARLECDAHGFVSRSPLLEKMVSCYRSYQKDPTYGNIVLQVNSDDITLQVAEYALTHLDIDTVEIKLSQAARVLHMSHPFMIMRQLLS